MVKDVWGRCVWDGGEGGQGITGRKKCGLKELPTSCKVRDLYREGRVFNEFGNGRDTHEAGT